FLVESESARDVAALHRTARGILAVVSAVTAFGLGLLEPRGDGAKPRSGIVRAGGFEPGHQVVIGPAQHRAAVLDLIAPGDVLRTGPAPEVVIQVSSRRRARAETPMINVRAGGGVAFDRALAAEPRVDRLRLLRRGEVVVDRFVVE